MFGIVPGPLSSYLPSFRHALVDLARLEDPALSTKVRLRAFLKALKYSRRVDLADCIDVLLAEAPVLDEKDLFVILTYLDKGSAVLNHKIMGEALRRLVPNQTEQIMGCITQPFYDQGKAEGKAEAAANILTRLLERRFGTLSDPLRQRILGADVSSIEAWVDRAFDAPDLQSIFNAN
jgi:uncharacterized protein DUF4351